MSEPLLLCVLPAERASLAGAVQRAGAVPVIDFTCSARVKVPEGAWVRVTTRRSVPGTGPVILAGGRHDAPVRGRETWLEVTEPGPVPEGFAGIVLRGLEAGGLCGKEPGLDLLARVSADTPVLLEAGCDPAAAGRAVAMGARGVVLSDVLLALPELELPPRLRDHLDRADASTSHVFNGVRIECAPLAPVLRRLLDGASLWEQANGWFTADDPSEHAWPAGQAIRRAGALAREYGRLSELIHAYRTAIAQPSEGSAARPQVAPARPVSADELVAVIGLGCRLPGANSIAEYWDLILQGRSAITEVPRDRWDPALYWDPDPGTPDHTYCKIGGFIRGFQFNPKRFRIPPMVARSVDPVQQIALESAAEALEDAGYRALPEGPGKEFDRKRCAVILGNSMGGEVGDDYALRVRYPALRQALEEVPDFAKLPRGVQARILAAFEENVKHNLPPITEDSMAGELANVIAGRVANALDLAGANFTVDAACASSMAAIQAAVKGLVDREYDLAITGGADRSMDVPTYTKFCKIGALSPDHSAPFDASANGFVMGEGCGIVVLKRLADAERDGDRIYAVIRGIGASSDGRGKGITAPNPTGQLLALWRAYEAAGVDPADVDLVECHGTSTVVGDKVEVECLTQVIGAGRRGRRGPVRIGSVKSNIGHLKSAAGAASCIKTALALYHKVFPPSINFRKARPDVPFDVVPLQVQTRAEPWVADDHRRRAGVSAFGFGGTNFHIVMEEYTAGAKPAAQADRSRPVEVRDRPLPAGVWAISAQDRYELLRALKSEPDPAHRYRPFEPSSPVRMAAASTTPEDRAEQVKRALRVLERDGDPALLRGRGVYLEEEPFDGKIAFLFTGQGSQYLDMGLDLAEAFPVVARTFEEADEVMTSELGRPLTDYIRRDPSVPEQEQLERLRATEISQPATLMVDVAILRLLAAFGVLADMVAGHSLGEYAAAVAAGMLDFPSALRAVSARGREMAAVRIDDKGRMAGIAASIEVVNEVLAEIPGYVVAANKNCPSQTVIAGESDAVEAAIERFRSRGITVYPLPVSHAFHSKIVAPASEPLRKVLERLDLKPPQRPITTNVTSRYYPTGEGAREAAIDILARQVASPVEWIAQIERMYADGARVFVECGPKRALTGFVVSILKRRPHRAIYTNHPKRGGVTSFYDALAALIALGVPVKPEPDAEVPDLLAEPAPRLATSVAIARRSRGEAPTEPEPAAEASRFVADRVLEIVAEVTGYDPEELSLDDELEADLGIDTVKQAEVVAIVRDRFRLEHDPAFRLSDHRTLRDLANYAARRLRATRIDPLPARARPRPAQPRPAPVAPSTPAPAVPGDVLSALADAAVRAGLSSKGADEIARSVAPALQSLVQALAAAVAPARATSEAPAPPARAASESPGASPTLEPQMPPFGPPAVDIVASGVSVGLPGGREVFAEDNFQRILAGENRISLLPESVQDRMVAKHIVRLEKEARTGQGTFVPVNSRDEVIRLAGVKAHFDLVGDYGVDAAWVRALDVTTQLAFAAGIEALRDAGIPLVRTWRTTTKGTRVATGWALPEALRDTTGIVFASAFPGYSALIDYLKNGGDDGEGRFDRRFLFRILAMGHSQFAQFIGARGPNTQVNVACASTTFAVGVAADWIRTGRCDRVVVLGADDVTNDELMEWIGAGFLATGAATTEDRVEEAALPFDARRHGMIIGMGAVGLVIERAESAAERGIRPIARLLADRMANSAFHGTRLDPEHIASEMDRLIDEATRRAGVDRSAFASQALFMSHETYTPANGGSAAAEIASLRRAFGDDASRVVIANTKGFTGHAMGAGIEDAVAIKALQYRTVPPVPNLKRPDPDLGDLTLSKGGAYDVRFGIRLAAGFGSQLALLAWEKIADGDDRVADAGVREAWLREVSGLAHPELVVEHRTLRVVEARPEPAVQPMTEEGGPSVQAPEASRRVALRDRDAPPLSEEQALARLVEVIALKSGYDPEEIDPDYELEADLGIDTVKQAEIFAEVRERFGIPRDDDFRLADYPTIRDLAGWLVKQVAKHREDEAEPPSTIERLFDPTEEESPIETAAPVEMGVEIETGAEVAAPPPPARGEVDRDEVLSSFLELLSEKTGYDPEELDPDYELEADLGIDTVKQAEIFAEVRERFGIPRDDDFRLADHPTIASLVDWMTSKMKGDAVARSVTPPSPVEATQPEQQPLAVPVASSGSRPAGSAAAGGVDRDEVLSSFLELLSEKTGYDPEELDPDYELEADLGIDTVKQAEIFAEVRERFGIPRDDDFRLADHPTIASLVDWMTSKMAAAGDAAGSEPRDAIEPDGGRPQPADASGAGGDSTAVSELGARPRHRALPPSFRIRRPVMVERPPWAVGTLQGRVVRVLGDSEFAASLRTEVRARGGLCDGVPDAIIDAGDHVFDSFELAREVDRARPKDWVCVTRLGADWSRVDLQQGLVHGARAGFAKALGREWRDCYARVLDVDPALGDHEAAAIVCEELAAGDGAIEIWRDRQRRRTLELRVEDFPDPAEPPAEPPVIVLTGGTRGITAQVALELARRGPCKLALFARTAPADAPLDEAAAKETIKARLREAGERTSPTQVERALAPLRAAEEARRNVAEMRARGAEVRFYAVDMAVPKQVEAALDRVRDELGPISGVVHGAGVEESRLIGAKDMEAFHRVFDGKALGGLILARHLESDAWLVSMGSVAGRFGNAGQCDYSAANEAMARICLARPRSLHVDWTAWADVGMAVRGGMEKLLTDRGVELLPARAGARLLVDLVGAGVTGEIVVAGRLGDFTVAPTHALLDSVDLDGDAVTVTRTLSRETDPWILDHAIDGVPVLPGAIGLELMAAAAGLVRPGLSYAGARDVRFRTPVKLHRDEPVKVSVRAEPIEGGEVRCVLTSERKLRTGRALRGEHFEAVVRLGEPEKIEALPPAFFTEESINRGAIYRRFFHGDAFQVLREAGAVAAEGLLAEAVAEHALVAGGLLSAPLVLEAAFQAAGLHRMAVEGVMALPAAIERVSLLHRPHDGDSLQIMVQMVSDGDGPTYHIDVDGPDGAVMRVRGYRMVDVGPLPPGERLPVPEGGWPRAIMGQAAVRPVSGGAVASDAEQMLTKAERAVLAARGTSERVADRLAGRLAVKRAVAGLTGRAPRTFSVDNEPSGRPVVDVDGVEISLSHRDGLAAGVAVRGGSPGIDLEVAEPRHPSFARQWLTAGEQVLAGSDPWRLAVVWSAKEAVLKALGTGLALDTNEVEIIAIEGHRVRVRLSGRAQAALRGSLVVTVGSLGGRVATAALVWPTRICAHAA